MSSPASEFGRNGDTRYFEIDVEMNYGTRCGISKHPVGDSKMVCTFP